MVKEADRDVEVKGLLGQSLCRVGVDIRRDRVPKVYRYWCIPATDGNFIVLFYPGMGTSVEIDHLA